MIEAIKKLDAKQKARLLDSMIMRMELINKKCGTTFGSYQILECIEDDAIKCGFVPCPKCGKVHE